MKKIIITCKEIGRNSTWKEDYNIPDDKDAKEYAESMVNRFNATLRDGETAREIVNVEIEGESTKQTHNWEKQNCFTLTNRTGTYDAYKCINCNITGKRRGLSGVVIRDNKYKAKIYDDCLSAKKHLQK